MNDTFTITLQTSLLRLGVSFILGAIIGLERQYHKHPAGIRTFTLTTLGSTLAMLVSIYVCQSNPDLTKGDPGRIAAQVVTGIGFIGAGLILKNGDSVSGITTAACIFFSAIIGLAAGAGMLITATAATLAAVMLLMIAPLVKSGKLDNRKDTKRK